VTVLTIHSQKDKTAVANVGQMSSTQTEDIEPPEVPELKEKQRTVAVSSFGTSMQCHDFPPPGKSEDETHGQWTIPKLRVTVPCHHASVHASQPNL
jgi:hypothetical protein